MGNWLARATLSEVFYSDMIYALGPEAPKIMSARIMSGHFMSTHSKVRYKNLILNII